MKRVVVILMALFIVSMSGEVSYASTADVDVSQHTRGGSRARKSSRPRVGIRIPIPSRNKSFIRFTFRNQPFFFNEGVVYVLVDNQYEVVDLVEGMIIPSLPEDMLRVVTLGERIYYESYDVIYQAIETSDGVQYQVVGWIE